VCQVLPTGLVAHYSARSRSSLSTPAIPAVNVWADLSGNLRNLGPNGAPNYSAACINGLPCVDFGGGRGMISPAFPITTDVTVFVVTQYRTPGSWGPFAHHGNRDGDWSMEQNGLKSVNVTHWQSVNDNSGVELSLSFGTNYILTGRITGATRYYSSTSTTAGTVSTSGSGNSISLGSKVLYVGKSDVNEPSNAYIGEFLYFNRSLTDPERDQVIAYLKAAWGI
jgi:hypothetical protein